MIPSKKSDVIAGLQTDILRLQGFRNLSSSALNSGLGPLTRSLPNASFPLGAVHEFLSASPEDLAASSGFISGLLSTLIAAHGTVLWISRSRNLFPPALKCFGIEPDRFIFVDVQKEKEVIWAMDEALKCGALSAVIGETQEISFTASRRLQLAVEQSQVTGFVIRTNCRKVNTTACVSRWKITSLPSERLEDLPGIGFPKWKVELLRIRNGKPGVWNIHWMNGRFHYDEIQNNESSLDIHQVSSIPASASARYQSLATAGTAASSIDYPASSIKLAV